MVEDLPGPETQRPPENTVICLLHGTCTPLCRHTHSNTAQIHKISSITSSVLLKFLGKEPYVIQFVYYNAILGGSGARVPKRGSWCTSVQQTLWYRLLHEWNLFNLHNGSVSLQGRVFIIYARKDIDYFNARTSVIFDDVSYLSNAKKWNLVAYR